MLTFKCKTNIVFASPWIHRFYLNNIVLVYPQVYVLCRNKTKLYTMAMNALIKDKKQHSDDINFVICAC